MLTSHEATEEAIQRAGLFHRVYRPEGDGPQPGVVFVHGRAGDAKVMWVFSKALEGIKPVVVSPQATEQESIGGNSWWNIEKFPPGDTALNPRDKIAVLEPAIAQLENFIDALPELYNIDPNRLYAAGFSQGAGLLTSLVVKHPNLFKGVALLSGFIPKTVCQSPQLLNPAFKSAKTLPEVFIFHGSADEVLPISRGEEARDFFASRGANVKFCSDEVGHKVSASGIREMKGWFEGVMC